MARLTLGAFPVRTAIAVGMIAGTAPCTSGQTTVSVVLKEGDPAPWLSTNSQVAFIDSVSAAPSGGFVARVTTVECPVVSAPCAQRRTHLWGTLENDPPAVLRASPLDVEGLVQCSFERRATLNPNGLLCYSPLMARSPDFPAQPAFGFYDSVWVGDTPYALEGSLRSSGSCWRHFCRVGITADDKPFWVGGLTTSHGAPSTKDCLFLHNGTSAVSKLVSGQVITGLPGALADNTCIGDFAVSRKAKHWMAVVRMKNLPATSDQAVIYGSSVGSATGYKVADALIQKGQLVPGTLPALGERWLQFGQVLVNNRDGALLQRVITGRTTSSQGTGWIVYRNGEVVRRRGQIVGDHLLEGPIHGAAMNDSGDLATVWVTEGVSMSRDTLFLNDTVLLTYDTPINIGPGDPWLVTSIQGIEALGLTERNSNNGTVRVYAIVNLRQQDVSDHTLNGDDRLQVLLKIESFVGPSGTPCRPDWNQSGQLSSQDIFDFLNDWFAGTGDYDDDGEVEVEDIFDFLNAWFAGCP